MKEHITLIHENGQRRTIQTKNFTMLKFIFPPVDILLKGFPEKAIFNGVLTLLGWVPGIVHNHLFTKKELKKQIVRLVGKGYYAKPEDKKTLEKLLK